MGMQLAGKIDFITPYLENGDMYGMIVNIIKTMQELHLSWCWYC